MSALARVGWASARECVCASLFMFKPFPCAEAFCCARELNTLVARSRERFLTKIRTSGEAVLWERVMFSAFATKQLVARAIDLTGSISRGLCSDGFQLPRERRKNGLMSKFFGLFWQNLRSRALLKKATPRVAAHIRFLTIETN